MRSDRGFTMIEMLLAMSFVAFLMITIALTTITMVHTYQRGIILSQINRAGRAVITDLQRTVSQAPIRQDQTNIAHTSNSLCFGSFSYVWNTGADIAQNKSPSHTGLITYNGGGDLDGKVVRLAKVNDPGQSMCNSPGGPTSVPAAKATELLPSDSSDSTAYNGIAIQGDISASQVGFDGTQALYSVAFILGTNDQTALDKDSSFAAAPSCKPPSDGDLAYCAVNRFQFLIRAGGGHYDSVD